MYKVHKRIGGDRSPKITNDRAEKRDAPKIISFLGFGVGPRLVSEKLWEKVPRMDVFGVKKSCHCYYSWLPWPVPKSTTYRLEISILAGPDQFWWAFL